MRIETEITSPDQICSYCGYTHTIPQEVVCDVSITKKLYKYASDKEKFFALNPVFKRPKELDPKKEVDLHKEEFIKFMYQLRLRR